MARAGFAVAVCMVLMLTAAGWGQETLRQYLSGVDKDNAVRWEFYCTAGRNSGRWTTIPVPSNWEFHGFGNYAYGKDDTSKPVEQGKYRYAFTVPAEWAQKRVFIVFDGSMTDTEVWINGQSAGPKHQGSFYRFRYDITKLLKVGQKNLLEATVSKLSSDETVNRAERQSDYWIFGGIFRPVWLEALPQQHIERVAIDARAEGAFAMDVFLQQISGADAVEAQIRTLDGQAVGPVVSMALKAGQESVAVKTSVPNPRTWTSETPNLYQVEVKLKEAGRVVHQIRQRFGFRTVEVRPGEGIYVNGQRVLLKGANRHSFWPDSGRALSRKVSEMDVKVMKEMNMNAVRMSHYPPDEHFLEVCDEEGLFVLDELGGWQKSYGTEVGRKLVEEMIQRDVNHPSIIFWDNGNEGGWNTELDGEFARWDPQKRQVIHPWGIFGPIDSKHYAVWDQYTKGLAGEKIYMPTEFLHALYDGGGGAGLRDYWEAMRGSRVGGGGFIWALVDEGVVRTDRDGAIDTAGNLGPDGLVGPYRQKEGSFYTVKELWSPVVVSKLSPGGFDGNLAVENRYHFTNLDQCTFAWELRRFRRPGDAEAGHVVVARGTLKGPALGPGQRGTLKLEWPTDKNVAEAVALRVDDPQGREVWTWVWPIGSGGRPEALAEAGVAAGFSEDESSMTLSGSGTVVRLSKETGRIISVEAGTKAVSLSNGPRLVVGEAKVASLRHRQDGSAQVVEVAYEGDMKSAIWRMEGGGLLSLEYAYEISGRQPFLGITFDYPEGRLKATKWLGYGPYRVWKNRMEGGRLGVWETAYNETLTGKKSWIYPEFRGYFREVRWVKFTTDEVPITITIDGQGLFVRVLGDPKESDKKADPRGATPAYPAGDLSILHAIPPMGNKFHQAGQVGPQGQLTEASGVYRGKVSLRFGQ